MVRMVDMNKFKEPAVYALTHDGGFFYVGYTSSNTLNRWWQHISRAQNGHDAPVYRWMRDVGIRNVGYQILELVENPSEAGEIEAGWIKTLIDEGHELTNAIARDGTAHSISEEMRSRMGVKMKGKPTWIKGLTGADAGWTEERKENHSATMRRKRAQAEMDNPEALFARIEKIEIAEMRQVIKETERPIPPRATRMPRTAKEYEHGTRGMYEHAGCRCGDCRDEMARHNAKKRGNPGWESVTARPLEPGYKIHGTIASYNHGKCRCDECKAARRNHDKAKKEQEA